MSNNAIKLDPVTSSLIESVGHDPETNTLAVKFKSDGSVWHYGDFDTAAYKALQGSASVGKHFINNIKGKYAANRHS